MRILVATFGSLGDLHPYLAIAEKLVQQSARVSFVTSAQHRDLVEASGHHFYPMRPEISPSPIFFQRCMNEWTGGRFLLCDVLFPAIRDSYADILAAIPGHDVLVTQMAAVAGPLAARVSGVPWVSTVLAPLSFLSMQDPSVFAAPLIGLRRHSPGLTRIINGLTKRFTEGSLHGVKQFQADLGLPYGGNPIFEGQHSPHRVLALFSKHFAAPQSDWPKNTIATGFPLRPPEPVPPVIEQFLADGPPPIVFTLGSSAVFTPGKFFDIASSLGRRAILLAGPGAANIPSTPDLLAVDYAPHSAVFPHAAAIVHQGGIGTLSEALRSGRPSLIIPFAHDQPDNAARCERLGVARILTRRGLSLKNMKQALDSLLNNSTFSNAARRLSEEIKKEDGAAAATRLILEMQNALS